MHVRVSRQVYFLGLSFIIHLCYFSLHFVIFFFFIYCETHYKLAFSNVNNQGYTCRYVQVLQPPFSDSKRLLEKSCIVFNGKLFLWSQHYNRHLILSHQIKTFINLQRVAHFLSRFQKIPVISLFFLDIFIFSKRKKIKAF